MDNMINPFLEKSTFLYDSSVVGTISTLPSLEAALRLQEGDVDFLELRVDGFAGSEESLARLEASAPQLPFPLIVTARHPEEGGAGALSPERRRALLYRFNLYATLVDLELRSAIDFSEVRQEAAKLKAGVILSHHDFTETPPLERLQALALHAEELGCSVFKAATVVKTAQSLSVLLQFLAWAAARRDSLQKGSPAFAVMGMGTFGKVSRLVLGRAGSALNYGYLDAPQVPGQWPAALLKTRLAEL